MITVSQFSKQTPRYNTYCKLVGDSAAIPKMAVTGLWGWDPVCSAHVPVSKLAHSFGISKWVGAGCHWDCVQRHLNPGPPWASLLSRTRHQRRWPQHNEISVKSDSNNGFIGPRSQAFCDESPAGSSNDSLRACVLPRSVTTFLVIMLT